MSKDPKFLSYDIDLDEIQAIQNQLGGSLDQVKAAHNRAVARTLVTIQKSSRKVVKDEIGAKSSKALQKRVMGFRLKASNTVSDKQMKIWFGLNDVSAHVLKGSMSKLPEGARFSSGKLGSHSFRRGFIVGKDGKKYLFERDGRAKGGYHAARIKLSESVQEALEDNVFHEIPDVYYHHFEIDLKGRIKTGLSKDGPEKTRSR